MELKWVEDFLDLLETRSFSASALNRNVTQPAFSRRIRALENWLGEPLFDRRKKPIMVTNAGLRFHGVAQEFVNHATAAKGMKDHESAPIIAAPPIPTQLVKPLIAVLPLTALLSDQDSGLVSRGLADAIASELVRTSFSNVISPSRVFKVIDAGHSIDEITETLGASYVVDGAYIVAENHIRVTIRLFDQSRQKIMWSNKYNALSVQLSIDIDSIAAKIAWSIDGVLERKLGREATDYNHERLSVFMHFLLAKYVFLENYTTSYTKARRHFERALELDPAFNRAYTGLAHTYAREFHIYPQRRDCLHSAIELAAQAVQLDPEDAAAKIWLGQFLAYDGEFDKARAAAERALELEPNDPQTICGAGVVAFFSGRYKYAESMYLRCLDLKPNFSQRVRHSLGHLCYLTRRFEEAADYYEGMVDTVAWNYSWRLAALGQLGRTQELERCKAYFRSTYSKEERQIVMSLYSFHDPEAVPLLIDGYDRAGILEDVGFDRLSSLTANSSRRSSTA